MVTIKSKKEIELMREACKVVALTYEELEKRIKPGMTTLELDEIAEKTMRKLGANPAVNVPNAISNIPAREPPNMIPNAFS